MRFFASRALSTLALITFALDLGRPTALLKLLAKSAKPSYKGNWSSMAQEANQQSELSETTPVDVARRDRSNVPNELRCSCNAAAPARISCASTSSLATIRYSNSIKGLRMRNSPMCTLSQNGYGDCLSSRNQLFIKTRQISNFVDFATMCTHLMTTDQVAGHPFGCNSKVLQKTVHQNIAVQVDAHARAHGCDFNMVCEDA